MSVQDLIGISRKNADFLVTPQKIRWDSSPTITQNQIIQMTFPKYNDAMIDARSIRACFYLKGVSEEPGGPFLDGAANVVFAKLRVLSGTREIANIMEAALLNQQLSDIKTDNSNSDLRDFVRGEGTVGERQAWYSLPNGRQYETHLFPDKSFLNNDCLIPIGRMGQLQVEITFNSFQKSICALVDVTSSWVISNFEIHCDYVQSNTISEYFNSNPFRVSVTDYQWTQNSFLSATNALLRIPSNSTSLAKILTILRDPVFSQGIVTADKNRVASVSGSNIMEYNVRMNQQYLYPQSIDGYGKLSVEMYEEFVDAFPEVKHSLFYDSTFLTGYKNRIAINLESCPVKFRDQLVSGVKTSDLNESITLEILFASPVTCRVDSFLFSDAVISLPAFKGDLVITR